MYRKQRGYTIIELLMVIWFMFVATAGVAVVGTVIWALVRLVTHFT
jgi:type II secretory pathway pseudopilin PulG